MCLIIKIIFEYLSFENHLNSNLGSKIFFLYFYVVILLELQVNHTFYISDFQVKYCTNELAFGCGH